MKKLILISIINLIIINCIYSQNDTLSAYDKYRVKFIEFYDAANYDSAFFYAEKSLYQAEADSGKNSVLYSRALNNIGLVYEKTNEREKAEECYLQAVDLVSEEKLNNRKYFDIFIRNLGNLYLSSENYLTAKTYLTDKNYSKASELFEKTLLDFDKKYFSKDTNNYITILINSAYTFLVLENYEKAVLCYKKAVNVYFALDKNCKSSYLSSIINTLGEIYKSTETYTKASDYYNNGDFINATELFEKNLKDFDKEIFKNDTTNYIDILYLTAYCYFRTYNYEKALLYYSEAINIYNNVDTNCLSSQLADLENNLGLIYEKTGDYENAKEHYLKALDIKIVISNKKSTTYKLTLKNLGELLRNSTDYSLAYEYYQNEEYEKAIPLFEKSLPDYKKEYFDNDTIYYHEILYSLAFSNRKIKNYLKSEYYYLELIDVYNNVVDNSKSQLLANLTLGLGELYREAENYAKAEEYFTKALNLYNLLYSYDEYYHSVVYNNFAMLYLYNIKDFQKAEKYSLKAIPLDKKKYGENSLEYAFDTHLLAIIYYHLGNYFKATEILMQCSEIHKELIGENSSEYSQDMNALGIIFWELGLNSYAEEYFLKCIEIDKNISGEKSFQYASALCNLANVYTNYRDFDKAEEIFIQTGDIYKDLFGENSSYYSLIINNLGSIYFLRKNYDKAEEYYLRDLEIQLKFTTKDNLSLAKTYRNLAYLYSLTENYKKAEEYYILLNDNVNTQIQTNFEFLTETEKEKFIRMTSIYFNSINLFIFLYMNQKPEIAEIAYNNELAHKGMILNSTAAFKYAILNSPDTLVQNTYSKFLTTKQLLSKLYSLPIEERYLNTDSVEDVANSLEKEIFLNLEGIENPQKFIVTKWTDVQNSLKENEATIEFTNFTYSVGDTLSSKKSNFEMYGKIDTVNYINLYCALILTKKMKFPEMIFLFEENQLDTLFYKNEYSDEFKYIKKLYSHSSKISDSIYNFVWQPFDSLLTDIKTVYISPSGILNKIAFDAVPNSETTLLSDKYTIKYVSSTAKIVNQKEFYSSEIENVALFGDINYDLEITEMQQIAENMNIKNENSLSRSFDYMLDTTSRGGVWQYLAGTKTETNEIKNIFEKNNFSTNLYSQNQATEEQFKSFSNNSPSLIHIATHGFYFPNVESNKETFAFMENEIQYVFSENPLLRSGIILSGGNNIWSDIEIPENVEDGVLSAYEISNLNLFGTKLVVLSACQTGLGDVKRSEGVFGLRRALKMAGVEYIIMSLWSVPDEQTKELMTEFYKNFLSGKEIHSAFKDAQNYMKEKYKDVPGAAYAWAAFVLIE